MPFQKTIRDTETARWFLKCRSKECGHKWAIEFPRELRSYSCKGGLIEFVEKTPCPKCARVPSYGYPHFIMGEVIGQRIGWHVSESPCDGRCTGAKGPTCDCPCGGINHGTGRVVVRKVDAGPAPRI